MTDAEINRAIAEKVMGWRDATNSPDVSAPMFFMEGETLYARPIHESIPEKIDFCNSPEACFGPGGVVEKMNERGMVLGLRQVWIADGTTLWQASFDSTQNQYYDTQHDSITHAVCLAALEAVEE